MDSRRSRRSSNKRMVDIPDIKCRQKQDIYFHVFGWSLVSVLNLFLFHTEFYGSFTRVRIPSLPLHTSTIHYLYFFSAFVVIMPNKLTTLLTLFFGNLKLSRKIII